MKGKVVVCDIQTSVLIKTMKLNKQLPDNIKMICFCLRLYKAVTMNVHGQLLQNLKYTTKV